MANEVNVLRSMVGSTPAACGESVTTVVINACCCTCGRGDEQLAPDPWPDRGTSILDEHGAKPVADVKVGTAFGVA